MILIINTSKRKAQAIGDIFYYMGIISYAATPLEALAEVSETYRAILVVDPDSLPDADSYVDKLRSYGARTPIFAITADVNSRRYNELFDGVFADDIYSSKLIEKIVTYQHERHLPIISQYKLGGIDASCDTDKISVFDRVLTFTKTETMILRYLIRSYPTAQSAEEILKYAFKPLRKPEASGIRTHLSVMNKKFRELKGKNLFIAIPNTGYVIATPEIMQSIKEAT